MKKVKTDLQRITNLFIEAGTLKKIARSHRQQFYSDDLSDNIASHSFRVTMIALCIAEIFKADVEKVLIMSLFHDFGEIRSGDQNWVQKRYVKVLDGQIISDQLGGLIPGNRFYNFGQEYEELKSLEAKIVKDADNLEQLLLEKEYFEKGIKIAGDWMNSPSKITRLNTDIAKELAELIISTPISEWWSNLWTNKRIKD